MRSRQREACNAVIKRRGIPPNGRMAICAVAHRECRAGSGVHRIIRLLPGSQVASDRAAGRRRNLQIVIIVEVARGAGHVRMAIRQCKTRGAVVKHHVIPADRVMALRAVGSRKGRSRLRVRRIIGLLPGG